VGERISPTLNLSLGKWFTPGLGLRLQYSGLQAKGFTHNAKAAYIDSKADGNGYFKQKFNYMNFHGDVMFNLNALFGGYNPERAYEVIPYLGAGFAHAYSKPQENSFAMNVGILNKFRVSPVLDVNLELSSMFAEAVFDGEPGGKHGFDAVGAATVGITYYFKTRGFNKPEPKGIVLSQAEMDKLNDQLSYLVNESANLRSALAEKQATVVAVPEPKQIVVEKPSFPTQAVFFTIGSSKLSNQEQIGLSYMVEQIKKAPEYKLKLVGYADSATGTAEQNAALSKKRAEAVKDVLVKKYNIDADRIVTEGDGGVSHYSDPHLNRMVLINVTE
jgi:outer membrane protein OmpA-like peptidoglycan-associated protein